MRTIKKMVDESLPSEPTESKEEKAENAETLTIILNLQSGDAVSSVSAIKPEHLI